MRFEPWRSPFASSVLLWTVLAAPAAYAQTLTSTGTIAGRVLDLQTGEPIAKAAVSIGGQTATVANSATTSDDGSFTLTGVPPGTLELRVFTVGYGLLKKRVELTAGATLQLDLRLGQEALRDTQQITVTAPPFDSVVPDAPTQYSLYATELQDLSTVLATDPFRAVGSLPGVAANLDAYADFAVRGAGPGHVGVYIDGVLVDHPTYSLEDAGTIGSLSVLNGDVLRSVSLLSGAFPASYSDRTGAALDVATRDGARDRTATRVEANVLGVTATSEGPIGTAKKASWLVSGRQSYLGYLLDRLNVSNGLSINYRDIFAKLSYDLNTHNKIDVSTAYGDNGTTRSPIDIASQTANFFTTGTGQHGRSNLHWDWTLSPNTLAQAQGYWTHDREYDTNYISAVNLDTASNVYGFRQDVTHQSGRWNKLEVGFESRSPHQQRTSYTQWNYNTDTLGTGHPLLLFDNYAHSAWQPGGYLSDTVTLPKENLAISVGGRWAFFSPTSQTVWLPHAGAILKAGKSTQLTAAWGQYAQMPSLLNLYGAFGTPSLRAERATHETFAVDQFFTEKVRLHIELYNRQEHEDIDSPQTQFRLLANGQVGFPTLGPVLGNNLDAYARGFEISLQRRSANRLSGFIAYARSYSRYWQPGTTLSFPGDFDQRNTFSAYAAYRITRTVNLSANARYGSGLPLPGYFADSTLKAPGTSTVNFIYLLSQSRNAVREGDYQRDDIRINKVFNRKRFNLTLHGELENITNHTNYRYFRFAYFGNIAATDEAQGSRDTTLPILPAAGFTLEF